MLSNLLLITFFCRRRQFHVLYLAIVELLLVLLELLYVSVFVKFLLSQSLSKNILQTYKFKSAT